MPGPTNGSDGRLAELKAALVEQGRQVLAMIESAFDAAFAGDAQAADRVIELDEAIDKVDVDLEKSSVALLTDVAAGRVAMNEDQLRMVLTIVKVNNELERIADAGVSIAEQVATLTDIRTHLPETFRVMANSIIGILRDVVEALDRLDPSLAKRVLASEDTIEAFKRALTRDAQQQISHGEISLDKAFVLQEVANFCEIMAGHCTNIAEQVLYVATGKIVRHMAGHWEEFQLPNAAGQTD